MCADCYDRMAILDQFGKKFVGRLRAGIGMKPAFYSNYDNYAVGRLGPLFSHGTFRDRLPP